MQTDTELAPCDLILFGCVGDLSLRKLFPALYHLQAAGLLHEQSRIIGLARKPLDDESFAAQVEAAVRRAVGSAFKESHWQALLKRIRYLRLELSEPKDYLAIKTLVVDLSPTVIYYLATPPELYGTVCENLNASDAIVPGGRIALEKPVGHDLESSRCINDTVSRYFSESQIYRIDHYLGKETVQNLIALRFANNLFGSQWDQNHIDHVQITLAEEVGIEGRWGYYDRVGQMRDMVQNHLIQLLCMVAMDPPTQLTADSIRDEKLNVLRALRPITAKNVARRSVRGQYRAGQIDGVPCPGYLEEQGGRSNSDTETFVALRVSIDNWRWSGVPFYLRTGKRLADKVSEIVIHYKSQRHYIFDPRQRSMVQNKLIIRLQPDEGIRLRVATKEQSLQQGMALQSQALDLDFGGGQQGRIPDAYERLLLELMRGNSSLFVRRDEIEASWEWCDNLIDAWHQCQTPLEPYAAGSWGPDSADALISGRGRAWHQRVD
ncbi:glucose-6-phosphate dehydrogenase [Aestuariirhabdus litorea]|uniref:Glucose-6-phosphate 1-dehydrogenase n=2 Tax=Aestuariirhabdus litorea TaxID=2528527 RepID=A0A3P3VUX1_9GAMM|nr:glucose-6-phosphate dehydrogenase [Aestuariirhabdus litorea]RWW98640.1 glucose-6-phosphate dehydrogenase [Endozoicomonadaceae bacterium GTF-13]